MAVEFIETTNLVKWCENCWRSWAGGDIQTCLSHLRPTKAKWVAAIGSLSLALFFFSVFVLLCIFLSSVEIQTCCRIHGLHVTSFSASKVSDHHVYINIESGCACSLAPRWSLSVPLKRYGKRKCACALPIVFWRACRTNSCTLLSKNWNVRLHQCVQTAHR